MLLIHPCNVHRNLLASNRRLGVRLKHHPSSAKSVLVLFLSVMVVGYGEAARYNAPGDCEWVKIGPGTVEMSLRCRSTSRNDGGMNFSHIESMYTEKLRIFCEEVYYDIRLTDGSFVQLPHLKSLKIENCKIASLSTGALRGLPDLRNVTIRTHNVQWGTLSFVIEPESFKDTPLLEWLDLSMNNLHALPENIFFHLPHLKNVNLARNKLSSISRLGFERDSGLEHLLEIDLSYNRIKYLPDRVFSSLVNVQFLNIRDNKISQFGHTAFHELKKLQVLNLANNKIVQLPSQFLRDSEEVRELYLQNNSISVLSSGTFDGLKQVLVLNLSRNHITSLGHTKDVFADLVRLIVLDLSYNRLTTINATAFQNQQSLQILYLDHNLIETINDTAFSNLHNLFSLVMNTNRLRIIDVNTLNGLYVLSSLDLNHNHIHSIHHEAFKNCTNLQDLQLEGNRFTKIPNAIASLHLLKTLNVAYNGIRDITNSTFHGTKQLLYLSAEHNEIGNLSRGILRDISGLKSLDLAHNKIEALEHGIFDDAPGLQVLILNDNQLSDINGLFMNLHSLELLNVSRNRITWFDYALIPIELKELDMHDNKIETLGNYFELEYKLHLMYIDASHNLLTELPQTCLPDRIEHVNLNNNRIKAINTYTFMSKENLTRVDLTHNRLTTLDINVFRLKTFQTMKTVPEFKISENPYLCDCTMEWLQRLDNLDETRQYPKMDVKNVLCQMPFPKHSLPRSLMNLTTIDFLCKYRSHCFALCHCCDFDACDCEMVCPENCTCYSDQTWYSNIVECSFQGFTNIPSRVPMDATELYLDGNDMSHLSSHRFIGRKNLRVLYLNNSNINHIPNRTFIGLQNLQVLHLEQNKLRILHGFEFENLTRLRELYLSYNQLQYINNATFQSLKSLKILHLEYNYLVEYSVWELGAIKSLSIVSVSHNQWSCNCKFTEEFHEWLVVSGNVVDARDIRCYYNNTPGPYLLHYNSSACNNQTMVTYLQAVFTEDFMPIMIVMPILIFLLLMSLIVFCIYRQDLKMWLFSRYGVRIFHRTRYTPESEKLFDAFISYCKKDEAFVNQILVPQLECRPPTYRLCLCFRDIPAPTFMNEAVAEAVDSSHRTMCVISEQFLKNDNCRLELKTAFQEMQCNKRHKLILILLEKVSLKELDPDARQYLRHSEVIRWGDRNFWQKVRYAMPEVRAQRHITATDHRVPPLTMMSEANIKFV